MRAPTFWKYKTSLSTVLLPISVVYGFLSRVNYRRKQSEKVGLKVICIGNLVAGGAGKTPVAIALGTMLKQLGKNVHFISRGYKSDNKGVTRVDVNRHTAQQVGDEPLLLARVLPTWVGKDRVACAKAAKEAGADIVILDDGFQNPFLYKDVSLLVIDGHYGFGNERVIPAGPLREPIEEAMSRTSVVVMIGEDKHDVARHIPHGVPVFRADITVAESALQLSGKRVLAFCGIGRPRKFYRTLQELGCMVKKHIAYPDHYHFKLDDLKTLREKSKQYEAQLVTTEKDFVRLPEDMRNEVSVVAIEAVFRDVAAFLGTVLA